MTWDAVSALGTVFTGLVVLITAIVGIGQLRQFRGQRQDGAAVELVRSFQDDSFVRAAGLVLSLNATISADDLAKAGREFDEAALLMAFRFELLGVLVHRKVIPFDMAEDLVGGLVVGTWSRMKSTAVCRRETMDWPVYLEWFQWLAEQFERRNRFEQIPAFTRHKSWRPT